MKYETLLFAMLVCACASNNGKTDNSAAIMQAALSSHLLTLPRQGELVILGVSGRQSSKDDEIYLAKEDAARKVSMYNRVWAGTQSIQSIGSGLFDYYVDSEILVEYDRNLERYMDALSYDPDRDLIRNEDGAIFIRFTYPAAFPGNIDYRFGRNLDGSPEWTNRPPHEIGGFLAGVGRSGRQSRFGDTVMKSYEAAAASIASKVLTSMTTSDTSSLNQNETMIRSQSSGILTQFLVLETWIDPNNRAVYTLAVARNAD